VSIPLHYQQRDTDKCRASAVAIMNMTGHVCAIAVSFSFRDAPLYFTGKGLGLASSGLAAILAPTMIMYLTR
jgi:hypothetical protein